MFSTAQLEIIRSHVPRMREQGYLYYLAIECSYMNKTSPEYCPYDLMILYSKEPIYYYSVKSIQYSVDADNIYFGFQSGNYNGYSESGFTPRYGIGYDFNEVLPNLDNFYWVSGNCLNEYVSSTIIDVTYTEVKQNDTTSGLLFIACVFIFFYSFLKLFRR